MTSTTMPLPTTATPGPGGFDHLGLAPEILKAIGQAGYTAPTPVQARAVPAVLSGRDLLVSSRTGSGKTAAFVWPALQRSVAARRDPTRGQVPGRPQ
ncbi:MAG: DEAD/DEAH box helicase, partial [Burkholderiales bacterium]|nr:DEAD/DEAH box helicase [Burkholderiales bacterium]